MKIINEYISVETKGDPELIDITGDIVDILKKSGMKKGSLTVFVTGSTAAITTFEYEPGMVRDMKEFYE